MLVKRPETGIMLSDWAGLQPARKYPPNCAISGCSVPNVKACREGLSVRDENVSPAQSEEGWTRWLPKLAPGSCTAPASSPAWAQGVQEAQIADSGRLSWRYGNTLIIHFWAGQRCAGDVMAGAQPT